MHLAIALLFVWIAGSPPTTPSPEGPRPPLAYMPLRPGLSDGGGGATGRKAAPAPLRQVTRSAAAFTLPQLPAALTSLQLPGAPAVLSAAGSVGNGRDNGADKGTGDGDGTGSGPRTGPWLGDGDGAFDDGAPGVTSPRVLFEKPPEYTAEAMRAKTEGTVLMEATVRVDGTVGTVRILRALRESFGLDQKAVEAVRQWKFKPGTYMGKPVAVRVLIELSFNLR